MTENMFKLSISYNENKNKEIEKHKEYKQLCQYVYHNGTPLPENYKVLGYAYNADDGFYAEVIRKGNDIVIVTRGTEYLNDVENDFVMSSGKPPSQYYSLMELYNTQIAEMKKQEPNLKITFIGHSLGGTLSQLASITTGEDAVTFAAFGGEGLLPDSVKKVSAHIINYGSEKDLVFASRIDKHIGEVRLIDSVADLSSHKLEYWENLNEYIPYTKGNEQHITPETSLDIYDRRYFIDVIKSNKKAAGSSSDIKNYSSGKYKSTKSDCPGSYPVRGYTREDGTKVRGYVRDCYKHKGRIPKLDTLPLDELEKWIQELI